MATQQSSKSSKPGQGAAAKQPPQAVHIGGESIADRLLPHLKKIIVVMLLVGAVIGAVFFMRYRKREKEMRATAQAVGLFTELDRNIVAPPAAGSGSDAGSGSGSATPPATPPNDEKTFASSAERGTAGIAEIARRGVGGLVGPAFRASLLLDAGQYDEAIAAFKTGATAAGIDGAIAREGIGLALEAKAEQAEQAAKQALLEQALEAYRAVQPDAAGPRRDYALYHQGRILDTLQKRAEAIAAYEAALAVEDTELEASLKQRLARLEAGA